MTAVRVPAGQWHDRVVAARADGYSFLLALTAIDEVGVSEHIRLVLHVLDPDTGERLVLETLAERDDAHLADIADVFPGAAWLQRQAHDLFGVHFDGGDNRPLIYHGPGAPMRKDALLPQRVDTPWPGALEPGEGRAAPGRRKLVPPGVPDPALLADPDATAADIALSATGARVRGRR